MLYAINARFKPDVEAKRKPLQEAFNAHLMQPFLHIRLGGSLQDEEGRRIGILILIEADRREQVDNFLSTSPYTKAGLYERVDIEQCHLQVGG